MKCCPKYWDSHSRYNEAEEVKNDFYQPSHKLTNPKTHNKKSLARRKPTTKTSPNTDNQNNQTGNKKRKTKHNMARAPWHQNKTQYSRFLLTHYQFDKYQQLKIWQAWQQYLSDLSFQKAENKQNEHLKNETMEDTGTLGTGNNILYWTHLYWKEPNSSMTVYSVFKTWQHSVLICMLEHRSYNLNEHKFLWFKAEKWTRVSKLRRLVNSWLVIRFSCPVNYTWSHQEEQALSKVNTHIKKISYVKITLRWNIQVSKLVF